MLVYIIQLLNTPTKSILSVSIFQAIIAIAQKATLIGCIQKKQPVRVAFSLKHVILAIEVS